MTIHNEPPAQPHSDTSIAAATAIMPKRNELQEVVLHAFIRAGEHGLTDEELGRQVDMRPNTARVRRIELTKMGCIRPSPSDKKRLSSAGRRMTVWVATGVPADPPATAPPAKPPCFRHDPANFVEIREGGFIKRWCRTCDTYMGRVPVTKGGRLF